MQIAKKKCVCVVCVCGGVCGGDGGGGGGVEPQWHFSHSGSAVLWIFPAWLPLRITFSMVGSSNLKLRLNIKEMECLWNIIKHFHLYWFNYENSPVYMLNQNWEVHVMDCGSSEVKVYQTLTLSCCLWTNDPLEKYSLCSITLMSLHGNDIHITGHLRGKSPAHRWIPLTMMRNLDVFVVINLSSCWKNSRVAGNLRYLTSHVTSQ